MSKVVTTLAVLWIALAANRPAVAQDSPTVDLAAEIAALRHQLAEKPENLDLRFALAQRLAWIGEHELAREQALMVVGVVPAYLDAQLLLVRLDGWSRRFSDARRRLAVVVAADPKNIDAHALAVDIELWSGRGAAATRRADQLLAVDDGQAARFRRALVAELNLDRLGTRRWAKRTLELDDSHKGARSLLRTSKRVRLLAISELELFPIDENAVSFGQLVSATLFPRARWSATVGYDYRLRFGTENHRASVAAAYRVDPLLTVDARLRGGSVRVVPKLSAELGISRRFRKHYAAGLRYLGDKMPWPGQLHRAAITLGAGLPAGFELGARYEAGIFRYCSENDPVQSLSIRSDVTRGKFRAGASYGFGMELDRAPLPPFLEDRFGDEVCSADDSVDISLRDTRAQFGNFYAGYEDVGRLAIRVGAGSQYRFTGDWVHHSSISLSVWF